MAKGKQKTEALGASWNHEAFNVVEVHRSQITNAPYNPRRITDAGKRKLLEVVKRHALVAPITWNERTGHIVGGHQRIAQVDVLKGSKDYTLHVARIDVDEKTEVEINVALNNAEAQGEMDLGKLEELFQNYELSPEATGFDAADVYKLFGDDALTVPAAAEATAKLADDARAYLQRYDDVAKAKFASDDPCNFFLVVVFKDDQDRADFCAEHDLPDDRYQNGAKLRELLGVEGK
jgi:hypothetical protein